MIRKDFERWENAMIDAVNATGRLLLSLLIGLCSLTIVLSKKGKKELRRGRRKDQRADNEQNRASEARADNEQNRASEARAVSSN